MMKIEFLCSEKLTGIEICHWGIWKNASQPRDHEQENRCTIPKTRRQVINILWWNTQTIPKFAFNRTQYQSSFSMWLHGSLYMYTLWGHRKIVRLVLALQDYHRFYLLFLWLLTSIWCSRMYRCVRYIIHCTFSHRASDFRQMWIWKRFFQHNVNV